MLGILCCYSFPSVAFWLCFSPSVVAIVVSRSPKNQVFPWVAQDVQLPCNQRITREWHVSAWEFCLTWIEVHNF